MRIEPRSEASCPWYLKPFFWRQRRKYGEVLDAALRSLVTVRVSQLNGCSFCVDLNSATLLQRGASLEKVAALSQWRDSSLFDERERRALDYAEAMTLSGRGVTEQHIEALREHFDDDAVVELTGLIAFQNLSSKFNAALGVEPQGFCEMPQPAPDDVQTAPEIEKLRRLDPATSNSGPAVVRDPSGAKQWKN